MWTLKNRKWSLNRKFQQIPQNLALNEFLQKFRKTSTPCNRSQPYFCTQSSSMVCFRRVDRSSIRIPFNMLWALFYPYSEMFCRLGRLVPVREVSPAAPADPRSSHSHKSRCPRLFTSLKGLFTLTIYVCDCDIECKSVQHISSQQYARGHLLFCRQKFLCTY